MAHITYERVVRLRADLMIAEQRALGCKEFLVLNEQLDARLDQLTREADWLLDQAISLYDRGETQEASKACDRIAELILKAGRVVDRIRTLEEASESILVKANLEKDELVFELIALYC